MSLPLLFTAVATIAAASISLYWYNTDSTLSGNASNKSNYNALIVSLVCGILMFLFATLNMYFHHKTGGAGLNAGNLGKFQTMNYSGLNRFRG
jgi:divalent metal cation (Fe/Co/Zn/Cd) transporter